MSLLSYRSLPLPRVAVDWTLVCDIVAFPCHTHLHFELQSQNDVFDGRADRRPGQKQYVF